MIIHGEIQSCTLEKYKSKEGNDVTSFRLTVMDRSKAYRCLTPFFVGVRPDQFELLFGKKKPFELTDEKCTVVCTSMRGFGSAIMLPGAQIRLGHIAAEAFVEAPVALKAA